MLRLINGIGENDIFTLQTRRDDTPDVIDTPLMHNFDYRNDLNFVLPALQPNTLGGPQAIRLPAITTVDYFEIVPTRLRSIATSLSAFQIIKLGFFSPHGT
jgi:hypothetical protein